MSEEAVRADDVLDGKYRLVREVGRGAMGTVWEATHESLGQRVAIKVISQEHAGSLELRARFEREARAAAQLRSRYVVSVFDHGETAYGLPYIVMEFLEGESLEDRVARFGVIPLKDACRIARHVGRGLAKAHSRGIVHRDLKPANIFITENEDAHDDDDWTAKVLDFGIAKMEDFAERSTTRTGAVLGTPLFMSPEQVRGASTVDARADLYSLGMVVYNMLTGTFAFDGQSFGDLLISICTDELPTLSARAPGVSPAFDAWFAKACAREAAHRFQSAEEMVRALDLALEGTEGSRVSTGELSSGAYAIPPAHLAMTQSDDTRPGGTEHSIADSSGVATLTLMGAPRRRGLTYALGALALGAVAFGAYSLASPSVQNLPPATQEEQPSEEVSKTAVPSTVEASTAPPGQPASKAMELPALEPNPLDASPSELSTDPNGAGPTPVDEATNPSAGPVRVQAPPKSKQTTKTAPISAAKKTTDQTEPSAGGTPPSTTTPHVEPNPKPLDVGF